jgi:hypothetical protein
MSELPEWAKSIKIGESDHYFKPNLGIKIKTVSLAPGKSNKSVETLQHIINFMLDEDIDFDTEWGTYGEKTISGLKLVRQSLLGTYASFTPEEFKYLLEDFGIELV